MYTDVFAFLMKTSSREDQYRIAFRRALWPERPYRVDFFEKSCRPTVRELVENPENCPEMDVRKGNWASVIAKPIPEGLGTSWDGSRPQNPLPNIEKYRF